ncbi:MAG: hypothetical protein HYU44_15565 [Betaproteobacteria bacterium]|nr:hypothetical protein [Betaproteobacteria bacterium]
MATTLRGNDDMNGLFVRGYPQLADCLFAPLVREWDSEHWSEVGNWLNKAVDAYNSSIAALESRVLVSARRLRELEAAPEGIEIEVAAPIDHTTRVLLAPDLSQTPADESKR